MGLCPLKSQADCSLMNDINTFNIQGIMHQHDQNFILLKSKHFYSKSNVSIFVSSDLVELVLCKSRPTLFPVRQPRCFLLLVKWRSVLLLLAPKKNRKLFFLIWVTTSSLAFSTTLQLLLETQEIELDIDCVYTKQTWARNLIPKNDFSPTFKTILRSWIMRDHLMGRWCQVPAKHSLQCVWLPSADWAQ